MVSTIYPDYDWMAWKFARVPCRFWQPFENHKKYTKWLETQLNIKQLSDWYNITFSVTPSAILLLIYKDVAKVGGASLLASKYGNSIAALLVAVYPDYNWLPWKFERAPRNFWYSTENQRKFLNWAALQLNVNTLDDWYQVKQEVIISLRKSNG
jgi:hypothetical protein